MTLQTSKSSPCLVERIEIQEIAGKSTPNLQHIGSGRNTALFTLCIL
jgi:hypothetical protein